MYLRLIYLLLAGLTLFPSLLEATEIPTLSLSLGDSGDPDDWFTGLKIIMGLTGDGVTRRLPGRRTPSMSTPW